MRMEIVGLLIVLIGFCACAPQGDADANAPEAHKYDWGVNDKDSGNYFGQEQSSDDKGRVEGKYFVWLADGRLMTVEYYVDGDSGFVPKITFSDPDFTPPPADAPARPT